MKRLLYLLLALLADLSSLSAQTLDDSFIAPLPIRSGFINSLKVQPDGKILMGGDIAFYDTKRVNNLIRINPDGPLDDTFNFVYEGEFIVMDIEVSGSGEIIILVDNWFSFNSVFKPGAKIIRMNSDGTVVKETDTVSEAQFMALQDDGKVVVGANFLNDVIRYNDNLTEDEAFNNAMYFDGPVTSVNYFSGKLLVGGNFSKVNGVSKKNFARLNLDGSIDNTFDAGLGTDDYLGEPSIQSDGKILLTNSSIYSFNGEFNNGRPLRLNENGSLDKTFSFPKNLFPTSSSIVLSDAVFTDDGIYTASGYEVDGVYHDWLFRIHEDGSLDSGFQPVILDESGSQDIQLALSGEQLIATRTQATGSMFGVSKLNAFGIYEDTFKPQISRYGTIRFGDIVNGKIMVAGDFIRINGVETNSVARLNLDGSIDESFIVKENKGAVVQLKVLNDSKVLIASHREFFKIDSLGNLMDDVDWPSSEFYSVDKFEVLEDGKIMIGGFGYLARLNSDGSKDSSFDLGGYCCFSSNVFDFDVQDDKVIYGSVFSSLGGVDVNRLARLTSDGSVDTTFSTGSGPDDMVAMIKVLDDKGILVGGYFKQFDGVAVPNGLVKLSRDGKFDTVFNENQLSAPAPEVGSFSAAKVQQLAGRIFIRGHWAIYVVNTDGTVDENFRIPLKVDAISDIIVLDENTSNGRKKSDEGYLFALGSFSNLNSKSPSFLLKMVVKNKGAITSIEQSETVPSTIDVFPQPVNQTLKFRLNEKIQEFHATIYDLSGRNYLESDFFNTGNIVEVDMQNAAPGFYVLKIVTKSGKTDYAKFLKVR